MPNVSFGSTRLGRKTIELKGFTGRVSDKGTWSETYRTVDQDGRFVKSETYHSISYKLTDDEGSHASVSADEAEAGADDGDVVTAFWCDVNGEIHDANLAYYNHDRGKLGIVARTRNDVAGPPGHSYLLIVALVFALIGVMDIVDGDGEDWYIDFAVCIGLFYWILARRRKLLKLVDAAVARVKVERPGIRAVPAQPEPAGADGA